MKSVKFSSRKINSILLPLAVIILIGSPIGTNAQTVVVSEVRIKDQIGNPVHARVEFISYTDQSKIFRAIETNSNGVALANQRCDSDYRIRVAPMPDIYVPIDLQACEKIVEIPAQLPKTVELFLKKGEDAYKRQDYGTAILYASQAAEISKKSSSLKAEYLSARDLGVKSAAKEFSFFSASFKSTKNGPIVKNAFEFELKEWQMENSLKGTGKLDFDTQVKLFNKYSDLPAATAIQSVIFEAYTSNSTTKKP